MTPMIATHSSPDADALLSAYLLLRYHFNNNAIIVCVDRTTDLDYYDAVTDMGDVLDEATLRFDHHQLRGDASKTSAAKLVYEFLLHRQQCDIEHLAALVHLVNDADLGLDTVPVQTSHEVGFHAALSGFKAVYNDDTSTTQWAMNHFTFLNATLKHRYDAQFQLAAAMVFKSRDVIGLDRGNATMTRLAGSVYLPLFVAYIGEPIIVDKGTLYPWGIVRSKRGEAAGVHCADVIEEAQRLIGDGVALDLFVHSSGFIACSGSEKSQQPRDFVPPPFDAATWAKLIARAVDRLRNLS
jgi:hypothetical protein